MTREEQYNAAFEICDQAWEADRRVTPEEILALFDRFEEEQWRHCSDPPMGPNRPILWSNREWLDKTPIVVTSLHALHYVDEQDFWWRELPAPPQP